MDIVQAIIVLITGVWMVTMCFITDTRNIRSAIIFKVIPFFLGISCIFVGSKMIGLI